MAGGTVTGWSVRLRKDGSGELLEPPGYRDSINELGRQEDARQEARRRIADLARELLDLPKFLGITRYLDQVVIRRIARVANVLSEKDDPLLARDLLAGFVRDAGVVLANSRRVGVDETTAETCADEMIAKCAAAPREVIPFGRRLPKARLQLIAAIEASGARGAPRKDLRTESRKDAAWNALHALLKKMGMPAGSKETIKRARTRVRKG